MNFKKIIFTLVLVCLLVEAKKKHGNRHRGKKWNGFTENFDLAKFLSQVLESTPLLKPKSNVPAPGALQSGPPPAGSLNSVPAIGQMQVVTARTENKCEDLASWCSNYKRYCDHGTVKKYCKHSCDLCPKTQAPPVVEKKECKDTHTQCALGVKYGYCGGSQDQIDFMKKYCPKSCDFCHSKSCEDKSGADYCAQVNSNGHCSNLRYRSYLEKNCIKTCFDCKPCGISEMRKRHNSSGIVGGVGSKKGYFPWQVAIYYENEFTCGGTLISKTQVLTAAHCFNGRSKDVRKYKVVLGEHHRNYNEKTEKEFQISQITIHALYQGAEKDEHDIALMKMTGETEFSDLIAHACLPQVNELLKPGTKCYITGWGKTFHDGQAVDILQQLEVPVVKRSVCEKRNTFNFHVVSDRMICTGHDDGITFSSACHGDSGGPLSCETHPGIWTVYGVVSWGSPLCNGLDRYTVFTRIAMYKSWIKQNS